MEGLAGLVRAALWAARYRQAAKVQPECAAGWAKMEAKHAAEVERLADGIVSAQAGGLPARPALVRQSASR